MLGYRYKVLRSNLCAIVQFFLCFLRSFFPLQRIIKRLIQRYIYKTQSEMAQNAEAENGMYSSTSPCLTEMCKTIIT